MATAGIDSLSAVGAVPAARPKRRRRSRLADSIPHMRLKKPPGLLRAWFRKETALVAAFNAVASLILFLAAVRLTNVGASIMSEQMLAAAGMTSDASLGPLGGLIAALGVLILAIALRRDWGWATKTLGLASATILIVLGFWTLLQVGYGQFVPVLFRPELSLAADALVATIRAIEVGVVPFVVPGIAIVLGFLLSARQMKTAAHGRSGRLQYGLAFAGLTTSIASLAIGAYAEERRWTDVRAGYAQFTDFFLNRSTYATPFPQGVRCRVTDGFGPRLDPFNRRRVEFHQGIDIAVPYGTPVHAIAAGRVVFAARDGGLGNMVGIEIASDAASKLTLVSGHMRALFVHEGDVIRPGQVIGEAGSTGRSSGPHVHFQLCRSGHKNRRGTFRCDAPLNPYEAWSTLSAIAGAACRQGPTMT
jgi:murein DD-endopeptidase MepM/ murein hydrolase activator NlpD